MRATIFEGFPDVWSAMKAAEDAVDEAMVQYQDRKAWWPDHTDL